jgi:hypothetical protein
MRRGLAPGGILRIIVPDMRRYVEAYLADDWAMLNEIDVGGEWPQAAFATKMETLNHVLVQDGEHYGGADAAYWRESRSPDRSIDREQQRPFSSMEACL